MKLKRLVLPFSLLVLNANAAVSADLKLPEPKAPFLKGKETSAEIKAAISADGVHFGGSRLLWNNSNVENLSYLIGNTPAWTLSSRFNPAPSWAPFQKFTQKIGRRIDLTIPLGIMDQEIPERAKQKTPDSGIAFQNGPPENIHGFLLVVQMEGTEQHGTSFVLS